MERNELRIGNWMLTSGGYMQVTGIAWNTCWFDDLDYYHTEIKGIPLTPEILLKAGFEMLNDEWYKIETMGLELSISKKDFRFCIDTPMGQVLFGQYKYLHLLQNIVYAISGHELTINL